MTLTLWHAIVQVIASAAVVWGIYLLAGLAYALVFGGACVLLVSVAAELSRPRPSRKPPHVEAARGA